MKRYFTESKTRDIKTILIETVPVLQAERIMERAEQILAKLKEENKELPPLEKFHTENNIFPNIALYQAMQEFIPKEEALAVMERASRKKAEAIGLKLKNTVRTRRASVLFLNAFAKMADLLFGEKAGFQTRHYDTEKNDIRFDMLVCPYHKWFTRYGCGELCRFSCVSDEYAYGSLDHIVFERSMTLGTGGECCDFHVYLKKEENKPLRVHEYGTENEKTIVLFHPLAVRWDVFERVIPELSKKFHLIIPAIPGFDPDQPETEFTSVEDIVAQMTDWLILHGKQQVTCLYGCSMGGSLVIRMIAEGKIHPACAVIDAGITPYELPRSLTYAIGARDWAMIEAGKLLSPKVLGALMDTDQMSSEDLAYVSDVLKQTSSKTAWNGFYSANNYSMPDEIHQPDYPVVYWYGEKEEKARKKDIRFVKKTYPSVSFKVLKGQDHAESFTYHPEQFVKDLVQFIHTAETGQ